MFDCFVRPLSKLCGLAVFTVAVAAGAAYPADWAL